MKSPAESPTSPFIDLLRIQQVRAANGESELLLPLEPFHLNAWKIAHGGVTMTLLDSALALAARSVAPANTGVVTVEMKTNFMQPGQGCLCAFGRVLHKSSTMVYCEGEVRDNNGAFVAKALGTFKFLRERPLGRLK